MEERIFSCEKLSFMERLKKGSTSKIIVILILMSLCFISEASEENVFFKVTFIGFLYAILLLIIIPFVTASKYIYEVRMNNDKVTLFGEYYNHKWCKVFEIKDLSVKIVERKYRTDSRFLIVFRSKKTKHTINRSQTWNNFTLFELFRTFKELKQEEIIWDEKYTLQALEKKARDEYEWEDI